MVKSLAAHMLEAIAAAAYGKPAFGDYPRPSDKSTEVLPVLQHPWFRRVWVLQEVAAARHVVIMCRSTEIDGHAFSIGIREMRLDSVDPSAMSRVRSAAFLIEKVTTRPKYASSSAESERFSLDIASLGELMDMYYNRETSDSRDQVYAILGMASGSIPADLMPDYSVLWEELFHRLVRSQLGQEVLVQPWEERYGAVLINTKIQVLGWVCWVTRWPSTSFGYGQRASIEIKGIDQSSTKWTGSWTLQTAHAIQKQDLLCLPQGTQKPIIIRISLGHHPIILAISVPMLRINDELEENLSEWTRTGWAALVE